MTWRKREIIEMAREAGMNVVDDKYSLLQFLEAFAKLVREDEREACAKLCESEGIRIDASYMTCAAVIRARGNHD